jgi:hypothetical protein
VFAISQGSRHDAECAVLFTFCEEQHRQGRGHICSATLKLRARYP